MSLVKIIIIDDEPFDLFINKKLLSLEFEVEGFTSVDETINWARQNTFDVVLIDYYLGPNLYAQHVLKELLMIAGKQFKAFVLSNYVDPQQERELMEAGFADIILKPLTLEIFKLKVNM